MSKKSAKKKPPKKSEAEEDAVDRQMDTIRTTSEWKTMVEKALAGFREKRKKRLDALNLGKVQQMVEDARGWLEDVKDGRRKLATVSLVSLDALDCLVTDAQEIRDTASYILEREEDDDGEDA